MPRPRHRESRGRDCGGSLPGRYRCYPYTPPAITTTRGHPTRRAVLDWVVSSYTPTVRALVQARQRQRHRRRALVVGVDQAPGVPPLNHAEREAGYVHQLLGAGSTLLLGHEATHADITSALTEASQAHFACHAYADQDDPAESHLALYDKPLRVRELSEMHLPHAYLAYLSACTTAVTAERLIDESIHVASAFQLAGCAHTIATLWPIADVRARAIAGHIYQEIATGTPPAFAVHHAIHASRGDPESGRHPYLWASLIHFGP